MADYSDLCERIRRHCHSRRWYGSDVEESWTFARSVTFYDIDGTPHLWDPTQFEAGFARPTATREQIEHAEATLGCRLPEALKQVYAQVSNGGFGPGYGLVDVDSLRQAANGGWRLSDHAAASLEAHPRHFLECDELPDELTQLCDWGCGLNSHLDLSRGCVSGAGCGERSDWSGAPPDASEYVICMDFQATSVEDWFERWMSGVLDQPLFNVEGFEHYRP